MANLMMGGKGGGSGTAEQTLQETRNWGKLRRHYEVQGGQGYKRNLLVKVIGVKHPHQIEKTVNGVKMLINWGEETPEDKRTKVNDAGKTVAMQPGCLITFETMEPGVEGLRFYSDGTYSGNEKTALFKTGKAIFGNAIVGQQIDPDTDYLEKTLLVTVEMGPDHERKTADGSPAKGGCYWNVRDYLPVPKAAGSLTDDDDEDFPTPTAPTRGNTSPAPTATATALAPSSSRTAVATLDDDLDDVPF